MAVSKKAGAKPKLREKMRAGYRKMIAEERNSIDAEPAPKGKCKCGCK